MSSIAPGGGGKIPIMPNYVLCRSDSKLILRNYEGVVTTYTQPPDTTTDCGRCKICKNTYKLCAPTGGVATLLNGEKIVIEPENLKRKHRKE